MIFINGKKFAENEEEFLNSLFESDGTCVGYVKITGRTVKILDHNKNLVGVLNKYGVLCKATKTSDGKDWFSYGDIDLIGEFSSYSEKSNLADDISCKTGWEKNERVYWYKNSYSA